MNNLVNASNASKSVSRIIRTALLLCVGFALCAMLWIATAPVANAREMNAADMLRSKLPSSKTLANASQPELLQAVCGAINMSRRDAGAIVREAIAAQRGSARDIVATAVRCVRSGEMRHDGKETIDAKSDPCGLISDIYNGARSADPEDASALLDEIVGLAPDCHGVLGRGGDLGEFNSNVPANVNPPPGSFGGGASRGLCLVCHNGHEIQIPCDQVPKYLKNHPGDNAGPCRPTPTTNL